MATACFGGGEAAADNDVYTVTRTDAEWRKLLYAGSLRKCCATRAPKLRAPARSTPKSAKASTTAAGCDQPAYRQRATEIPLRHGLAQLLPADQGRGEGEDRQHFRHDPHRGSLQPLRRPPRPRLRRRHPATTGLRYCINGVSLQFVAAWSVLDRRAPAPEEPPLRRRLRRRSGRTGAGSRMARSRARRREPVEQCRIRSIIATRSKRSPSWNRDCVALLRLATRGRKSATRDRARH